MGGMLHKDPTQHCAQACEVKEMLKLPLKWLEK